MVRIINTQLSDVNSEPHKELSNNRIREVLPESTDKLNFGIPDKDRIGTFSRIVNNTIRESEITQIGTAIRGLNVEGTGLDESYLGFYDDPAKQDPDFYDNNKKQLYIDDLETGDKRFKDGVPENLEKRLMKMNTLQELDNQVGIYLDEDERQKIWDTSTWWQQGIGSVAGIVASPSTYIAVGSVKKGTSALIGGLEIGGKLAAIEAARELGIFQPTTYQRSLQESATNILGAALFGAVAGSGIQLIKNRFGKDPVGKPKYKYNNQTGGLDKLNKSDFDEIAAETIKVVNGEPSTGIKWADTPEDISNYKDTSVSKEDLKLAPKELKDNYKKISSDINKLDIRKSKLYKLAEKLGCKL